jgi:hypothetical protein
MEIVIIAVIVVAVGLLIYFNRGSKGLDVNADGKVDAADAKAAVDNTVAGVKKAADVDGDGKVSVADAKAAVAKTKQAVRKGTPRNRPASQQPKKATGAKK